MIELLSVHTEPAGDSRVRLVGRVSYGDRGGDTEAYWFEFPSAYRDALSTSGNPWLACLAPLALAFNRPLKIGLPVDALLLRNVEELMAVWRAWYPSLRPIRLLAVPTEAAKHTRRRTALFFSGGVDSLFSLYRNESDAPVGLAIHDLVAVQGFDMPIDRVDVFERHRERLQRIADATGKTLVPVRSNLRRTRLREAPWGALWHGAALASVGLALEGRYDRLVVASTNHYAALDEWGSHPLTDPLLSTSATRVLHDGAAFWRWEKLEFLSGIELALSSLHVCYRNADDRNCGQCEKCLRNMIILEVLGRLDGCGAFPFRSIDLRRVSRILLRESWQPDFYSRLRAFAASRGRADVAAAIGRSLRRSRWLGPPVRAMERLRRKRFASRLVGPVHQWVLAASPR